MAGYVPATLYSEGSRDMKKEVRYEICGNYVKVFLSNSDKYFLCDLDDLEIAQSCSWSISSDGYARGWNGKKKKSVKFHKEIFQVQKGYVTDHINRNRLDNRKCNLRAVTVIQNANNKKNQQTLPAKGVRKIVNSKGERFIVNVKTNDCKTKYIGVFDTLEKAIDARNKAYLDIKGVPFPYI